VPDCVTASTKLPDGITWIMGRWLRCADCDFMPQANRTTLKELQKHRKEEHGPASEEAAAAATISVPVDALSVGTCTSEQCSSSHEAAFITALLEQRGGSPNRQHRILVRQLSPEQWHSLGSLESKLIALDFAPRDEILSDAQRVKLMQQHIRPSPRVVAPPEVQELLRREGLNVEREEDGYFDALWTEWVKKSAVEHPVVCLILYDWKEIAQADEPNVVRASASWASVGKWFGRIAPGVVYKLFAFDLKVDRGSQTPDGTRSGASGSVSVYPLAFPGAGVHVAVTPTVDEDIQQPDQVSTTSSALGLKRTETRVTQTIHRHTPNSIQFSGTHSASRNVTLLQWHPKVQQTDSTTSTSTTKTSWACVPATESAPVTSHSGPQAGARVSAPSVPTDAEFRVAGVASVPAAARAILPVNLHKPC